MSKLQLRLEERINNAIVRLATRSKHEVSPERYAAIDALARHWWNFWQSEERRLTPTAILYPKLIRYLRWYTRAWVLVPPAVKQDVPSPDSIEPSAGQAMMETLRAYQQHQADLREAGSDALRDAWGFLWSDHGSLAAWTDEQAKRLRKVIELAYDAGTAMKIGATAGLVFGAGLVLYLMMRKGR